MILRSLSATRCLRADTRENDDLRLTAFAVRLMDESIAFEKCHSSETLWFTVPTLERTRAKSPCQRRDRPSAAVPGGPKPGV